MFDLGGTYRSVSPVETLARVEPLLKSHFGITRVANLTGLDNIQIPTYVAVRPLSKNLTTAQGKGITHDLAKISAIMESIECWHAENIRTPELYGTYLSLSDKYNLLSLNTPFWGNSTFNLPQNTLETLEIPWSLARELISEQDIYIPTQLVDMDFSNRYRLEQMLFSSNSTGLASGNSYDEALCHALYEVIERDCENDFVTENKEGVAEYMLDLTTVNSPHIHDLFKRINRNELNLVVYDMTNQLDIPAYMAYLIDLTGTRIGGAFRGAGCHFSSVVALSRAITEAIQTRLTIISGSRDDTYPTLYKELNNYVSVEETFGSQACKSFIETEIPANFSECLQVLMERLKQNGYEQVIVYNHTRPELDIPVVHAIVPGMKVAHSLHIRPGYSHCIL